MNARLSDLQFDYVDIPAGRFRVARLGQGLPVIFVHGFPESWSSWQSIMPAIAQAGYMALALDVRGYGESPNPHNVEAYCLEALCGDILALIGCYGGRAVLVGHDHGAPLAWTSALLAPDQVSGVAGLSIPHTAPGAAPAIESFKTYFSDRGRFFYQVYFQDIGVAEAEFEADPAGLLRRFFYALSGEAPDGSWPREKAHGARLGEGLPDRMPRWLSPSELDYYVSQFSKSGFHGPLHRYRNHHRDWQYLNSFDNYVIRPPSLFIGGERDLALKMFAGDIVASMSPLMADLRGCHMLAGCGHWTQQERPQEVAELLVDWLAGL